MVLLGGGLFKVDMDSNGTDQTNVKQIGSPLRDCGGIHILLLLNTLIKCENLTHLIISSTVLGSLR